MPRRLVPLPVVALCLIVGGCGFFQEVKAIYTPPTIPLALELFSVINTQKTLGDHVMSLITGKDCSLLRAERDEDYCVPKRDWRPSPPQPVYCYRSLGHVSCYAQPLTVGNDTPVLGSTTPPPRP
ncbi:MAG: hypothetical protein ABT940_08895 [Alphaproteobacteria bacterium]